jgi:hypothetical protein
MVLLKLVWADDEELDANFVVVSDSFRRPQKLVF